MKHTPGPWEQVPNFPERIISKKESICFCVDNPSRAIECSANAKLIAAAPELLEACRVVLGMILQREQEKGYADSYDVAAAAWLKMVISKAEEEK